MPLFFPSFSRHILEYYLKLGHRSFLPNPYPLTTPSAFAVLSKPVVFKAFNICGSLVNKSEFSRKLSEVMAYLGSQMKFKFFTLSSLVINLCTTRFNINLRYARTVYICVLYGSQSGADPGFGGPESYTIFGTLFKKKNTKLRMKN
jgi:hypothetical protein